MMKAIALIFGLLVLGIAPQAHANFYHLGAGGCRTPAGGAGTYVVHRNIGWRECTRRCEQNDRCTAVEYTLQHTGGSVCEVHTAPINRTTGYAYNSQTNVSCWGYTR